MKIELLGPLKLSHDGRQLAVTAPKPRKVLTLLLLNAGFIVPVRALMTEIWGEESPRSASTTLQTYILQLRRGLSSLLNLPAPEVANRILVTREGGYVLWTAGMALDVKEYESLAREGRAAFGKGDYGEAARLLHRALDLWEGPALVDVAAGPLIQAEILRLEESRLGLMELYIETDLRLGRHNEILSEITALISMNPLNESLHEKFMIALYRAGRRSEALDVFQKLRSGLIQELGLEPTSRLQRLQQRILSSDPALDLSMVDSPAPVGVPLFNANLACRLLAQGCHVGREPVNMQCPL